MKKTQRLVWVQAALLAALLSPTLLASEGGEGSDTFLGLPRWIWLWANLLLFLGVLGYFVVPPIRSFLETRAKGIREDLERSRQQRQDAENMKASLEGQIGELKQEMDEILTRAEADAHREREEILAQAELERERLLTRTQEEIRLRVDQAREELTAHTARIAADLARQQIQDEIEPSDLDRIFDDSVTRLEREVE